MEMSAFVQEAKGEPLTMRWIRSDSLAGARSDPGTATLVRETDEGRIYTADISAGYDEERQRYLIGVRGPEGSPVTRQVLFEEFGIQETSFGPVEALKAGFTETWTTGKTIVVTLKRVITGRDSLTETLGGPVMIAKVTSEAASAGSIPYWRLIAALSITLAIMNILPIPALDGGQLLFLLYEAVTRRRPSVRVRLVAQQVGMILLIGFMAFLIFNDILRL
jgi:regulator of sigma E protease